MRGFDFLLSPRLGCWATAIAVLAVLGGAAPSAAAPAAGPLQTHPANPRYFREPAGGLVYLTGSHTWSNLLDQGTVAFNFTAYLDLLTARNHNFIRLWTDEARVNYYTNSPQPYLTTTIPGAADGGNKFDLTQFNEAYFQRLRDRVSAARDRGIYVGIMLFNGWSTHTRTTQHPWPAHPYHAANNINGINGDLSGNNEGEEVHTLALTNITALQQAYIRKVVDTVNDLDNVLYEISNESPSSSTAWQYAMINYLKSYEATKPKRHPVGMTFQWPDGNNAALTNSPADWYSPGGTSFQTTITPAPALKPSLLDTDHIFGVGGDAVWIWKSFLRGHQPNYMDRLDTNIVAEGARVAMGQTLAWARTLNLTNATPRGDLAATGYCLADPVNEYLAYQPGSGAFTVNLGTNTAAFRANWFNPATGATNTAPEVSGGGVQNFTPPFSGPAVLHLKLAGSNQPPAIDMEHPLDGSAHALAAPLTLAAIAADADGQVARVDFFANGGLVGTSLSAPFTVVVSNLAVGTHLVLASATDNLGATNCSTTVTFALGEIARLTAPALVNSSRRFKVQGSAGMSYRVDYSDDLTNWVPLVTEMDNGTGFKVDDPNAELLPKRFYRAVLVP